MVPVRQDSRQTSLHWSTPSCAFDPCPHTCISTSFWVNISSIRKVFIYPTIVIKLPPSLNGWNQRHPRKKSSHMSWERHSWGTTGSTWFRPLPPCQCHRVGLEARWCSCNSTTLPLACHHRGRGAKPQSGYCSDRHASTGWSSRILKKLVFELFEYELLGFLFFLLTDCFSELSVNPCRSKTNGTETLLDGK